MPNLESKLCRALRNAPFCPQDPFNKETRIHSDMANVSRAWPSVASRSSRLSELRARSSVASMRGPRSVKTPAEP